MNDVKVTRFAVSFHRTFLMRLPAVASLLSLSIKYSEEQKLTTKFIKEHTTLGSNHLEAMPRYAICVGLLDIDKRPTEFGRQAYLFDPQLTHPSTQWLMHYNISCPIGRGPLFWSKLVQTFFTPENSFSDNLLLSVLMETNPHIQKDVLSEARTAFIGSYTRDGLMYLHLIDFEDGNYHIPFPESPVSLWAMAIAFLDYCQRAYPGRATANLQDFLDNSGFEHIFLCSANRINKMLFLLKDHGYIDLFMTSPPYQIAFLKWDTAPLWEKVYNASDLD